MVGKRKQPAAAVTDEESGSDSGAPAVPLKSSKTRYEHDDDGGRAGIIEKVTLKNFMCHQNFSIAFGPALNFINGNNGSGKSTILCGLQVALGGKANSSKRAANMKGFIGSFGDTASVAVQLSNRGDGWEPERYGESIVIERVLTKTTTSFKLFGIKNGVRKAMKGSDGKTVRTSDVEAITDHFNIQVDNPNVILMQEVAKEFLQTGPEGHYRYFKQATQLQQIQNSLHETRVTLEKATAIIEAREEALDKYENDVLNPAAKAYKDASGLRKMQDDLKFVTRCLAWGLVRDEEQRYEKELGEVARAQAQLDKCRAKLEEHKSSTENSRGSQNELNEKMQAVATKITSLVNELKIAQRARKELDQMARNREQDVKLANRELTSAKRQHKASIDSLKHAEQEAANHQRDAMKAKEEQLQQKRNEVEKLEKQLNASNVATSEAQDEKQKAKEMLERVKGDCRAADKQVESLKKSAHLMQSRQANAVNGFGQWASKIVAKIDATGGWKQKPVGPLGYCLKIKDPEEWGLAIEHCLGQASQAFAVDNLEDQQKLQKIMTSVSDMPRSKQPQIVKRKFSDKVDAFAQKGNAVMTALGFPTVLSQVIEGSDPRAVNALVTWSNIDTRLLIPTVQDVQKTFVAGVRGQCYTRDGTMCATAASATGKFSRMRPGRNELKGVLKASGGDGMARIEAELAKHKEVLASLRQNEKKLNEAVESCHRKWNEHSGECNRLQASLHRAKRDLERIRGDLAVEAPDFGKLQAMVTDAMEKCVACEAKLKAAEKEHQKAVEGVQPAIDKEKDIREQAAQAQAEHDKMQELLSNSETAYAKQAQVAASLQTRVGRAEALVATVQSSANDLKEKADIAVKKAMVYYAPRVDDEHIKEDTDTLRKNQQSIDRQVNSASNSDGKTLPQIESDFRVATDRFETMTRKLQLVKKNAEVMEAGIAKRAALYKRIRDRLSARVGWDFNKYLTQRGFAGHIKCDHKLETMTFSINVQEASVSTENVKMLSGGESSYAGLCFGLALADNIETPFRALDEPDVFMDERNRRLSLEVLCETIRVIHDGTRKQYMVLTPVDSNSLPNAGPDVRRHYLHPVAKVKKTNINQRQMTIQAEGHVA